MLDLLQWPAMLVTVLAAWLVASQRKGRRELGFWVFLASNLLWVVWGWHAGAHALIVLQFALAIMNIRGVRKNEVDTG
jgi:sugar phosphate permease